MVMPLKSFQILSEPSAPRTRLVITTPSTDDLVQRWLQVLYKHHLSVHTKVVTAFSDLNKAFKAWIKLPITHILDLKFTELISQSHDQ